MDIPARTRDKYAALEPMLTDASTLLIVLQDNPDPDGLGAAMALRKLAHQAADVQCSITCGGMVGRAENRALVRYLGVNLRNIDELDLQRFDLLAMVDTQPQQGNNSLPAETRLDILIDHHPRRSASRSVPFTDIRSQYGATCTILYEYLQLAGIEPGPPLATALLYGIRSDTMDLGREATSADIAATGALYPLANARTLGAIQRGAVPGEYFAMLASSLANARLCGKAVYCPLGDVTQGDMIAEVSDLLLRHEQADWSLCWGYIEKQCRLSLRSNPPEPACGAVIQAVVADDGTGGGHRNMAGGQIGVTTADVRAGLDRAIVKRFRAALDLTGVRSRPLVRP